MSLNQFTLKFLKEIEVEKNISQLANKFNLTERSLRYKVEEINGILYAKLNKNILYVENSYIFIEEDIKYILNILSELQKNEISFIHEEREEVILIYILFYQEKIILDDFQDILDVSRSTLKKDLKKLKEKYKKFDLEIKSSSRYGLEFIGEEIIIRKVMLKKCLDYLIINENGVVIFNSLDSFSNKIIEKIICEFCSDNEILDIELYIRTIETESLKNVTDDAFRTLVFYVNILIKRINASKNLIGMNNRNFIFETEEFGIIRKNAQLLEKRFDLRIEVIELIKLTEYFLGSHSYNPRFSFYENWINLEIIADKIIKNVSDILKIDFTKDNELVKGIINHLLPTIYRIQNNIIFKNKDLSKEVKDQYKDIFYAVKNSIKTLEDYIEKEILDEEVAYLAIHFKLSLNKLEKSFSNKKKILLICGLGYGTSNLLKQELKESYNVEIVDIIPLNKLKTYNMKEIELIISTVKISALKVKTIIVNPVLSNADKESLLKNGLTTKIFNISIKSILEVVSNSCSINNKERLIRELKELIPIASEHTPKTSPSLLELLPFRNFKVMDKVDNWEEAVRVSGKILLKNNYIEENYIEDMIDTIKRLGSYMVIGKKIILPHAENNNNIKKTGMSFLKLKTPIEFPNNIGINYIVTLSVKEGREHIDALLQLKKMIDKYNFIDRIEEFDEKEYIFGEFNYLFEKFLRN